MDSIPKNGGRAAQARGHQLALRETCGILACNVPLIGRLVDKAGPRPVLIAGVLLMSLGMFFFKLFAGSLPLFIVAGVFVGLGLSGLLGSPVRYLTLRETDDLERSSAQGLVSLSGSMGQLVAAALIGAIVESTLAGGGAGGDQSAFPEKPAENGGRARRAGSA